MRLGDTGTWGLGDARTRGYGMQGLTDMGLRDADRHGDSRTCSRT